MQDNGFGVGSDPVLKPLDAIKRMDAVLAYDEEGKPVEPEWPKADVIIGNPPFLGDKKMRGELGDRYVEHLRTLYENRIPGQSDYVCYWFEKARTELVEGRVERAGLLATSSIRGGANRAVMDRIRSSTDIFWAQSDRDWILEGAAVNVSMIGFSAVPEPYRELDGKEVSVISADLTSSVDLTKARPLGENQNISFIGTQKSGAFDLADEQAHQMLSEAGNPNGRPNSDVIRPWINALDVTRRPRNMWIIDFGNDMAFEEASKYEAPFRYVEQHVKPSRFGSRPKSQAERWWIFARSRPAMRDAIADLARFIVMPRVAKHRLFVWMKQPTVLDCQLVVFAREDDYFLGILHSTPHELWALRLGTSLEDRPRYTPTTTFETFPFPWPLGHEPSEVAEPRVAAIAQAARELVETRDRWLNPGSLPASSLKSRTLTNLYNQRPTWLQNAHRKLDHAVLDAYGWPHDLEDDEILERLLALNLERSAITESRTR